MTRPHSVAALDAGAVVEAKPAMPEGMAHSIELTNAGVELFTQGSYTEAEQRFLAAVVAEPNNHSAWYSLGETRMKRSRAADAVEAYEQATSLAPDDAMYALRVGQARIHADLPAESARGHLERAVRLEPRLYRAHFYLGIVHHRAGRATDAARAFTAAIAANSAFGAAYVWLVELYLRWQRFDLALQVAGEGAERAADGSDQADLRYYAGLVHAKRNDHRKAVEELSRVLDAQPDHADALLMRGLSHAALGSKAQARADLDAYLERGVGNSFDMSRAREARLRLGVP